MNAPGIGEDDSYERTPGIDVQTINMPGIGKGSIWDCAGQAQFYVSHSLFFDPIKATFILLYKIVAYDKANKKLIRPMDIKEKTIKQV